jgi:alginate O-acetyltransferase complex protein AlgI
MGLKSFAFIVLSLPVVTAIYRGLVSGGRFPYAKAWLLAASLFFYARNGLRNVPYLLASLLFNYAVAHAIAAAQGPGRRRWLAAGIGANIAFLCSFKYFNFFLGALGSSHLSLPSLGFPLGVSFLTIQQIMYLVDCYEEMWKPNALLDHAVFATFFAYVTAGPISRARDIVPQLNSKQPRAAAADIARGITLFAIGLFKKVVFADAFAAIAGTGFSAPAALTLIESWTCAFAFTLQIYFDFSGYSDMAMAAALFLGIRLPRNFDNPLRSLSIREFWQRWHISLSNFITTYLYTPIVKSLGRVTIFSSMLATLLAMLIAGLWHGPAWTFVIFGAMHGAALAVNQYWKKKKRTMANPLAWALTMAWLTAVGALCWVNYRVDLYGLFGQDPDRGIVVYSNERSGKYLLSLRYVPERFDGLLVGTSMTDNWDTAQAAPIRMYNGSINGGNISEAKLVADNVLDRKNLTVVVFCIHPYLTATHGRKAGGMDAQEFWSALGSLQLLREYSVAYLISRGVKRGKWNASGVNDFEVNVQKRISWEQAGEPGLPEALSIDPVAYSEFAELVNRARAQGATVVRMSPPIY